MGIYIRRYAWYTGSLLQISQLTTVHVECMYMILRAFIGMHRTGMLQRFTDPTWNLTSYCTQSDPMEVILLSVTFLHMVIIHGKVTGSDKFSH